MRKLVLVMVSVMAAVTTAAADPTADVTALVKRNLDAMATTTGKGFTDTLAKEAVVYDGNGQPVDTADADRHAFAALYGSYASGKAKHKLGKLVVSVDAASGVAWFHGPFDATFTSSAGANPCGGGPSGPTTTMMRVSGVAVSGNHGWKIAAVMYTHPEPDNELIDHAQAQDLAMPSGAPAVSGDAAVASAVAAWFPNLSRAKTTGAVVVASGSAPGEYFDAATLPKYVKAWDTLGVTPSKIDVKLYGGGKLAFVHADTAIPIKNTKLGSPLEMAAIAVKEGDAWRWVSLQFAPAVPSW